MSAPRDLLGTLPAARNMGSPSPFESAALEQAGDGLLVVEAAGPAAAIVYSNAAFAALCGYSADEILGRRPFFVFAPAEHGALERLLQAALDGGAPQRAIAAAHSRSGASQWLSLVMRALAPPEPAGHVVITIFDASAQHAAQKRLADSEHHFRILLANAQDLVTVIDANACITFIAGGFARGVWGPSGGTPGPQCIRVRTPGRRGDGRPAPGGPRCNAGRA
jgi:PAS domain S-box-containing protein